MAPREALLLLSGLALSWKGIQAGTGAKGFGTQFSVTLDFDGG